MTWSPSVEAVPSGHDPRQALFTQLTGSACGWIHHLVSAEPRAHTQQCFLVAWCWSPPCLFLSGELVHTSVPAVHRARHLAPAAPAVIQRAGCLLCSAFSIPSPWGEPGGCRRWQQLRLGLCGDPR